MYLSKSDYAKFASNRFAFGLDTDYHAIQNFSELVLPKIVEAEGNPSIVDDEQWTRVSATFVADKAYTTLTIGDFSQYGTNGLTPTDSKDGGNSFGYTGQPEDRASYYFVDDVYLGQIQDPIVCNANPCNQNLTLVSPQDNISNATVQKITNQEIKANILIQGSSNVLLNSGKSILMDGQQGVFEVRAGVVFEAKIGGCEN